MTLRTLTPEPYNAEAELRALAAELTPVEEFYVRCNFAVPMLAAEEWTLRVGGRVRDPVELDLRALQELPRVSRRVTLECAGNGRRLMSPRPSGTPWHFGATGTALFVGVRLRDVLDLAGVEEDAVECVFTGADEGEVPGAGRIRFQRSLPLEVALSEDPLVAWEMNGAPLTPHHGQPVRLVVPGYYAIASVKWLDVIDVVDAPFRGHFQTDRYMYRGDGDGERPVTTMRVRSLITSHRDGDSIQSGTHVMEGVAWSGAGPIQRVEVAVSPDGPWITADLEPDGVRAAAVGWRCAVALGGGPCGVRVRATDSTGDTQTDAPCWNELGYGNNCIQSIELTVAGAT